MDGRKAVPARPYRPKKRSGGQPRSSFCAPIEAPIAVMPKHRAKEAPCAVPNGQRAPSIGGGPHGRAAKNRAAKSKGMAHTSSSNQPAPAPAAKKKSTQENAPEPACHSYAKTVRAVLTTPGHAPLLRSVPVSGEVLRRTGGLLGVGRAPAGFVGPGVTTCGGGADLRKVGSKLLACSGRAGCASGCAMGASAGRLQAEVGKNGKVREPRPVWGWWMRSAQRPALSLHGVCLF